MSLNQQQHDALKHSGVLSFQQFVESRQQCDDIGARLGFETDEVEAGYVYANSVYINQVDKGYLLTIYNDSVVDTDLSVLEHKLYHGFYRDEYAKRASLADGEVLGRDADGGLILWNAESLLLIDVPDQNQSIELKRLFKSYFQIAGLDMPLTPMLVRLSEKFTPEWDEAHQETERDIVTSDGGPDGRTHELYIKIAADSIATLRKVDVFRVIESVRSDNIDRVSRASLARWIAAQRRDLIEEVADVLEDLAN